MLNNDYYDIAINDLEYLQLNISTDYFNVMAISCQQIAEKMLKSIAELAVEDDKVLKSHNLRQINLELVRCSIDLNLDDFELAYLKDFYFDARYPGDNFIEVTEQDFNKILSIMYKVINAVNSFRRDKGLHTILINEIYPNKNKDDYTCDDIFNKYRVKYNIKEDEEWFSELYRLSCLTKSSNTENIAKFIKDNLL